MDLTTLPRPINLLLFFINKRSTITLAQSYQNKIAIVSFSGRTG
jgi:hypothetical protein